MKTGSSFSTEDPSRKRFGDGMEIQRGELINNRLSQNIEVAEYPLNAKKLCQYFLAIKESLRIDNGTQYTNYQINHYMKNHLYPKISHSDSLNVTKIHVAAIIRHEKRADMQNK